MLSKNLKIFFAITAISFLVTNKSGAQNFSNPNFELLITEIFADPTPSHGLPEKEFIELFNNTGQAINLQGYRLYYSNTFVEFPSFDFKPDTYIIVCRVTNGLAFQSFGDVVELSKFSLLNDGSLLRLTNPQNELVFEIQYSSKWYAADRDQGYSLEMIDKNYPCVEARNWTSSSNELGGTPGKTNAVSKAQPDVTPPYLLNTNIISDNEVELVFDEKLNQDLSSIQIYEKSNFVNMDSISLSANSVLKIKFDLHLEKDRFYDFIVGHVADCSGNVSLDFEFSIGTLSPADSGDILISELLFNPISNGNDFVEIINVSPKVQNLRNWSFANITEIGVAEKNTIISSNDLYIQANEILTFTVDKNSLLEIYKNAVNQQIIEVQNLPSLNNTEGSIAIVDPTGNIIDAFRYSENMHFKALDILDGVSIERKSLDISANDANNWISSSSTQSWATPGFRPVFDLANGKLKISLSSPILQPNGDDYEVEIGIENLETPALANLNIYNANGILIKNIWNNAYVASKPKAIWNALDLSGKLVPPGPYILHATLNIENEIFELTEKVIVGFFN